MNISELQVTLSFCLIFLLRMLGMFMILPVLSKYGMLLDGGNKFLIGLSIGIYGIAQVIFQIPFGILSDKFDRKKIIILGLFLFFIGNIIPAIFHSIWALVIGRFFQGSGAISGVCMAFLSELVRKEQYIKSIAAIGISFACSFFLSMILGPLIVQYFGFFSIFFMSSCFSIINIIIVFFVFPSKKHDLSIVKKDISCKNLFKLICNGIFFRLYLGVFFLHFLLMINFMILPNQLDSSGFSFDHQWKIYSSAILISFFILYFFIFYCKLKFVLEKIIEICILFILFSEIIFLFSNNNLLFLIISLQIFFLSFTFLEVFLPEKLRKSQLNEFKGSIMSIYSTSQFLGISFGGVLGGCLCNFLEVSKILYFQIFLVISWFLFSCFLSYKNFMK